MKKILMVLILGLAIVGNVPASNWTDNQDGTWSLTVTYTVTTQQKQMATQLLAEHNYARYWAGEERDASTWMQEMFVGFSGTRDGSDVAGYLQSWFSSFIRTWCSPQQLMNTVDHGITEGLAVTVPAPVQNPE